MRKISAAFVVVLLGWVIALEASAQAEAAAPSDFESWRIVNRFRLFYPWFGLPVSEKVTLMNAGLHTDPLLELSDIPYAKILAPENPGTADVKASAPDKFDDGCHPNAKSKDSNAECLREPRFYGCLYALSHGEKPVNCEGLNHGNYHQLFNWNPLNYRHEVPPGAPKLEGVNADPIRGDWIIEVELRQRSSNANDCVVSIRDGRSSESTWKKVSAGQCQGKKVRFAVPVEQRDKPIHVRVASGAVTIAEGTINPVDELLVVLGDSFGSGEGNPDLAGLLRRDSTSLQFTENPVWLDRRCNRSMHASPARAAMQLAAEKRDSNGDDHPNQRSVTFISFACSGAKITEGLLDRYDGVKNARQVADYLVEQYNFGRSTLADSEKQSHLERLQQRYAPGLASRAKLDECDSTPKPAECEIPLAFPAEFYHRLPPQVDALRKAFCTHVNESGKLNPSCGDTYVRNDINLVISIGGNDIGFAPLIADFVFSASRNAATVSRWKAVLDGGSPRIQEDYAKDAGFRSTVGLAAKISDDIDYLKVLFEKLDEGINNIQLRGPAKKRNSQDPKKLGTKDIFLIGYPSPNQDENGQPCHNQDFLGMPPFGQLWHISKSESEFAETRIVEKLQEKFREVASEKKYLLVDVATSRGDVFKRRGWCALGQSGAKPGEIWVNGESDRCERDSFAHDANWKAYCTRNRWFRTLADAGYTQGPVALIDFDGISNGAMHPTFEAHRYIGRRIYEEVLNDPPEFSPLGGSNLRDEACSNRPSDSSRTTCIGNEWITGGTFGIAVNDPHGLNFAQTSCRLLSSSGADFGPCRRAEPGDKLRTWTFNFDDPSTLNLPDGRYQIEINASDNKGKRSARKYNIGIDRNRPKIIEVKAQGAPGENNQWDSIRTFVVRASDGSDTPDTDCPASKVRRLEFLLADNDKAPDIGSKATCVVSVKDSRSCVAEADLTLFDQKRPENCRSPSEDGTSTLLPPIVSKVWVRAVDWAGWFGDWVDAGGKPLDLLDPSLSCKRSDGTNCSESSRIKLAPSESVLICAKYDSKIVDPAIVDPPQGTIVGEPEEGCRLVSFSSEGKLIATAKAESRSHRSLTKSWSVELIEPPSGATSATPMNSPQIPATEPSNRR